MNIAGKHRVLIAVCLVAVIATALAPRFGQDPAYHQFADQNSLFAIPNALNVLTNLLFACIGGAGLYRLLWQKSLLVEPEIYPVYLSFFGSLILIGIGSGYYHWSPDNLSLSWDRVPISMAFMSFFTILLAERISISLASKLFPLLVLAGIASIAYWHFSELAGRGDLRPYALVQFLPVILTPVFLLTYESRYTRNADIWWFLAWFLFSRVCELLDQQLYDWLVVVSGHSLKHIAASIGCLIFLRHLRFRKSQTR